MILNTKGNVFWYDFLTFFEIRISKTKKSTVKEFFTVDFLSNIAFS